MKFYSTNQNAYWGNLYALCVIGNMRYPPRYRFRHAIFYAFSQVMHFQRMLLLTSGL